MENIHVLLLLLLQRPSDHIHISFENIIINLCIPFSIFYNLQLSFSFEDNSTNPNEISNSFTKLSLLLMKKEIYAMLTLVYREYITSLKYVVEK